MSRRSAPPATALCLALLLPAADACAQIDLPDAFTDVAVVGGLSEPTNLCFLPDGRLLVVEQHAAQVRLVVNGAFAPTDPVLWVSDVNTSGGERGLLGIAADPGWPARPYVYLYYDHALSPTCRISRFTATGDVAFAGDGDFALDPLSRHDVLTTIPDVAAIHNGGSLRFGPDGMLYASLGDDGTACNAQDPAVLAGKILRLDVSGLPPGAGGPPAVATIAAAGNPFAASPDSNARLVWAYGLRNPFSFHVDPLTGDLFVADVGAATFEELNHVTEGGRNFGWPFYEGPLRHVFDCPAADTSAGFVAPIYWHANGPTTGASIIGGTIYRRPPGATTPFPASYEGDVFVSDLYEWFLRRLKNDGGTWSIAPEAGQPNATDWATSMRWSSDFQVGPDGALWYTMLWTNYPLPDGQVRRIYPANPASVGPVGPASGIALAAPRPSPARGEARIAYRLDRPRAVRLAIHDLAGRRVRTLVAGEVLGAGEHLARWDGRAHDGSAAPAGAYVVRLESAGESASRRLVWLR